MIKVFLHGFSLSEHRRMKKEMKFMEDIPVVENLPLPKEEEYPLVKIESSTEKEFSDIFLVIKSIAKRYEKLIFVDDPHHNVRRKITPHSRMCDPLRNTR